MYLNGRFVESATCCLCIIRPRSTEISCGQIKLYNFFNTSLCSIFHGLQLLLLRLLLLCHRIYSANSRLLGGTSHG